MAGWRKIKGGDEDKYLVEVVIHGAHQTNEAFQPQKISAHIYFLDFEEAVLAS
jgi:hypothetical protein